MKEILQRLSKDNVMVIVLTVLRAAAKARYEKQYAIL